MRGDLAFGLEKIAIPKKDIKITLIETADRIAVMPLKRLTPAPGYRELAARLNGSRQLLTRYEIRRIDRLL